MDNFEAMINALGRVGVSTQEAIETIQEFQQYIYNQLGTASSVMTENPKQKSDLEISSQIEMSDEFRNFINNSN